MKKFKALHTIHTTVGGVPTVLRPGELFEMAESEAAPLLRTQAMVAVPEVESEAAPLFGTQETEAVPGVESEASPLFGTQETEAVPGVEVEDDGLDEPVVQKSVRRRR